jgi:signal peptidase I
MDKQKLKKEIISWVIVIAIAVLLAFIINKTVIFKVTTPTGSMENTIMSNDKAYAFRLAYLFGKPERGDIVVFPFPDDESEDRIKRIIGLPGETIEGRDGTVYINGEPLEEPYVKEPWGDEVDGEGTFGPYQIPENCYFMMGDNRVYSLDARDWTNKFVSKDKIKGKLIFKYPNFKWLY